MWAALFCGGVTILGAVLGAAGIRAVPSGAVDARALLDAGLYLAVAWGIYKLNRVAAVAGLALYLGERLYAWAEVGLRSPIVAVILTLCFVHGVRGAFAYHRFGRVLDSQTPITPA